MSAVNYNLRQNRQVVSVIKIDRWNMLQILLWFFHGHKQLYLCLRERCNETLGITWWNISKRRIRRGEDNVWVLFRVHRTHQRHFISDPLWQAAGRMFWAVLEKNIREKAKVYCYLHISVWFLLLWCTNWPKVKLQSGRERQNHNKNWKHFESCKQQACPYNLHGACSWFAPSQWETALHYNDVSHWLGANLESALI